MAKFLKNDYCEGKLFAKHYELKCIKEPENKQDGRDLLKVGEVYECHKLMAPNWEGIYLVFLTKIHGTDAPEDCFEPLPNE